MCHDSSKPPIWPDDLPLIRELQTDESARTCSGEWFT